MVDALTRINTRGGTQTPQTEQARTDQVPNNAGGWGFAIDDWARALRFLILGSQGGTYYVGEKDLTRANADVILRLAQTDGVKLVELLVDVSEAGRAPRQNPTLFALAICAASEDDATRRAALAALPRICRIGTHLFLFTRYVEQFRGWGRGLRKAIGGWYDRQDPVGLAVEERRYTAADNVAFQSVKYRNREGWSHNDLLRLSHPLITAPDIRAVAAWITGNTDGTPAFTAKNGREFPARPNRYENGVRPRVIEGFELAQTATKPAEWARLVGEYRLPWEALPDAAMNSAEVWEALLPHTGITALIRQLGRLTNLGVIAPLGGKTNDVVASIMDPEVLKKGRVHPLQVLTALVTYQSGHGFRGDNSWTPNPKIVDALNEAFYLSFGAVEPADKRTLLGIDVSGSMASLIANSPITCATACAALAMVALRTEPEAYPMAFNQGLQPLHASASSRLDDVFRQVNGINGGGTDCSLPMQWASQNKVPVDTFQVLTDNETWAGSVHPYQALLRYRDIMGIPARLVVVGMTSSGFSIADPSDRGMMDVVGFDSAAPNIISAFSRGDL